MLLSIILICGFDTISTVIFHGASTPLKEKVHAEDVVGGTLRCPWLDLRRLRHSISRCFRKLLYGYRAQ